MRPIAEQVAEARERDAARRLAFGDERVACTLVRLRRDRVAVADADESALLLEEARASTASSIFTGSSPSCASSAAAASARAPSSAVAPGR